MQKLGSIVLSFLISASTAMAQKDIKTFYANDPSRKDIITFTSKAPLETIVGKTSEVIGLIEVDINELTVPVRARFEVDLATLKTGIDMRDGHMREQYLETDKYPKAIFELTKIVKSSQGKLEDQKPVEITAEGTFHVHGITRAITVPLTVTYFKESEGSKSRLPGDILRISGSWTLLLSDYKINRPQFIVLKLDDKQKIDIDITASTGSPAVSFTETSQAE